MPRPAPLPDALLQVPAFTVRQAQAASMSRARLRASDLESPTWGVRWGAGRDDGSVDLRERCHAFAQGLPADVAFSHVTAARLLGLPMPTRWTSAEPLDVMRDSRRPRIERAGCQGHRGLELRRVATPGGLPVVCGVDVWADLATVLDVADLVAVGDALVNRMGPSGPGRLLDLAAGRAGQRGARPLRIAAELVRPGARSPWETKARVIFAEWGLPEPELNGDVVGRDGSWLACADFVWRRQRVVGEYDGDQHRTDRRVWQYERERRAGLEADGWTYVEMTSLSLTVPRYRSALRARLELVLCS